MTLAFHACPPAGEWLNDPNALWHDGERWRLFAQHRADAPAFRATGWAALSSPDLLDWRFDGVALPPEGDRWMYSGSVVQTGEGLEVFHTLHERGLERQVVRPHLDRRWEELPLFDVPATNRRDPYVFPWRDEWRLLLAEPCDWHKWRDQPPSQLKLYGSNDRREWRELGTIGPYHPHGVMWEVPLLLEIDGRWVLIVSLVDRRDDGADCSVLAWIGDFDGAVFTPDRAEGQRLDHGPDFYAAMASVEGASPGPRGLVGWLSSWATARRDFWPGFWGGPVSLPRTLSIAADGLLSVAPLPGLVERFAQPTEPVPVAGLARVDRLCPLDLATTRGQCRIAFDQGVLTVERRGPELDWCGRFTVRLGDAPPLLFRDGPALELFVGGAAISIILPGGGLTVEADGASVHWWILPSATALPAAQSADL